MATTLFVGTHYPKLDDKGRLFLPAKFRDQLQGGLVMTKGQEHALFLFPRDEFMTLAERLQDAPLSSKSARDYMRVLLSGAADEVPDRQGRITIPAPLRTYAQLNKECVVIGMGSRVEIWNNESWNQYMSENEETYAGISEEVLPGLM
ncbi:MAG: division/cell wall cluster transcriptional repressor MraZ [Candidatus Nanopelagicales bacterium]